MTPRLDVIGIVSSDLGRTIDFYSRLGFEFPADAASQPHVEVPMPGGLRIAFDTVETIRSFDPKWIAPTGGHGIAPAFAFDSPAEVDEKYAELTGAGYDGHLEP